VNITIGYLKRYGAVYANVGYRGKQELKTKNAPKINGIIKE
jgi:hypothetical protein